ncbi:MAG: tyrosine-type recombinase/integrase [Chlamydiales bacterium]|nr:tyrosine-type recombinase/integrase [Chlamydiales bacterium]
MAASLGMRYGEIASLKWKNVDFEHRLITLETTKNQDARVLPMTDQIYSFLMSRCSSCQGNYIFPSKILQSNQLTPWFAKPFKQF